MRAIRARYNPYVQTRHRVEQVNDCVLFLFLRKVIEFSSIVFGFFSQLMQCGHSVDKVEFIVMGGTFMALPEDYRDYFIR